MQLRQCRGCCRFAADHDQPAGSTPMARSSHRLGWSAAVVKDVVPGLLVHSLRGHDVALDAHGIDVGTVSSEGSSDPFAEVGNTEPSSAKAEHGGRHQLPPMIDAP